MNLTRARRRSLPLVVAAALLGGLAVAAPAAEAAPSAKASAAKAMTAAPRIHRHTEIERAKSWLTANHGRPVPYSQNHRWQHGYRQDCSGFVSMALMLPKPGPNTVELKYDGFTRPIAMSTLKQGDLVIKADSSSSRIRHVVIFDRWADAKHTRYWVYEQAGGTGTRHTVHTYGLVKGDGYHAARPTNLIDG